MNFNVITLMPDLVQKTLEHGVVGSAFSDSKVRLKTVNPREFTEDVHQSVDDRPFGGGDGMLMMISPLEKSLQSLGLSSSHDIYYLSPQGEAFNDRMAKEWSEKEEITLICGRYGGVDQRFLSKNKIKEISIGDYVLSGGELAAAVIIDATVRKIPGVLGHSESANEDSFKNQLLEAPSFTRPRDYEGWCVPEILLSGDHAKIARFRELSALLVTLQKRPDLVKGLSVDIRDAKSFLEALNGEDLKVMGLDKERLLKKMESFPL